MYILYFYFKVTYCSIATIINKFRSQQLKRTKTVASKTLLALLIFLLYCYNWI